MSRRFGPYEIERDGNQATIRRLDGAPVEPTFYELQHMKSLAFGGPATAIEVFPAAVDLVDGQNQRHLWLVEHESVPNLRTGHLVRHEAGDGSDPRTGAVAALRDCP